MTHGWAPSPVVQLQLLQLLQLLQRAAVLRRSVVAGRYPNYPTATHARLVDYLPGGAGVGFVLRFIWLRRRIVFVLFASFWIHAYTSTLNPSLTPW